MVSTGQMWVLTRTASRSHIVKSINENDIFSVSDTGILGKRNSEFSQQESELVIGRS